jgi:serine/threonine-protein kinase RsbW
MLMTRHFSRSGLPADVHSAGVVRDELAHWLNHDLQLGRQLRADVTLAVYEAMINAAEHAYRDRKLVPTMSVHAECDTGTSTLAVEVRDHGQWRMPDRQSAHTRGRGITLMHALADQASVDSGEHGTSVGLCWHNVGVLPG